MGCTSSKGNTNSSTTTAISDSNQQLINDHFRKWLKSNRPKADEYVLNDVIATAPQSNNTDDYRTIVSKTLDLLSERSDIKNANKLGKFVQKEIPLASPKKIAHTINVLKKTAEKLDHGQIILDNDNQQEALTTNGETTNDKRLSGNQHGQPSSGEPGIALKEALEKARILFYKGKQAAIFANPSGGYIVRILDENDDDVQQDGNLLRSIVVTEVKMRPKPVSPPLPTVTSPFSSSIVPPPPGPSKPLNEYEICDDFRRSIDAALKGLESIYHTSPPVASEHPQDVHIDKALSSNVSPKPTLEDHTANLSDMVHQRKVIKDSNEQEEEEQQQQQQQQLPSQDISQIDIQPILVCAVDNMNEIMVDIIETTTESDIGKTKTSTSADRSEKPTNVEHMVNQAQEHTETFQSEECLSKRPTLSDPPAFATLIDNVEITTPSSNLIQEQTIFVHENRPESSIVNEVKHDDDQDNSHKQKALNDSAHLDEVNAPKLDVTTAATTTVTDIEKEAIVNNGSSSSSKVSVSISQINDDDKNILLDSSLPLVTASNDMNTIAKSPTHNVTYTEIIHSESRHGEQSRRFITESYDENPSNENDETTSCKIVTKSEFLNDPTLGEKTMEQSVQVITIKVRNETVTARNPSQTPDKDISHEKKSANNDANTVDITH